MSVIDRYLWFTDRASRAGELLAVVLLYGFCLLMLAEVFARGFVGKSLAYSWEYSTYAMAAVFFLGLGGALRRRTHVRVSLLLEHGGPGVARWIDLAATLVAAGFAIVVTWSLWTLFDTSLERGLRAASYTATPLAVPQFVVFAGAFLFVLELIARALRLWRDETPDEPLGTSLEPDVRPDIDAC